MSHLSNQLHEGARKRFDDLGLRLLSRVTTFRDNPARPRPDFSPDVFNGETLTDAGLSPSSACIINGRTPKQGS